MKIKSIRRRTTILLTMGMISILLLGLVVGVNIMPSAQADGQFTSKIITGTWGFSASGTVVDVGPAVAVGLFAFDGTGGCSLKDTFNIGNIGQVGPRTSTVCNYNVNQDGTGNLTAVFDEPFGGPVSLSFVIVNKENEIRFIRTDTGAVASGVAKRQ
jgi:hypothetical protein